MDSITLRGARTHNLKNFDLTIPRDQLVVITGLSGSGKSSLAFDTLYAEGQRRYVESLSAYARQFLSMMEKPDIDHIEGLSSAISIEQKRRRTIRVRRSARSPKSMTTCASSSRVGEPRCPNHGIPLAAQTISQMVDQVLALARDAHHALAPVMRNARRTQHVFRNSSPTVLSGAGRRHRYRPRSSADARQNKKHRSKPSSTGCAYAQTQQRCRIVRNRDQPRRRRRARVVHRR